MNPASPELVPMFASMAAGALMIQYGLRYKRLKWRQVVRRCPACSRHIKTRVCGHCANR
jgi:hypothetical protein